MKLTKLTIILTILLFFLVGAKAFAYDIAVANSDGVTIYYNYINEGKELELTRDNNHFGHYEGNIVIPSEVTYMNRVRKVTSIGNHAFEVCTGLTSITIPNSVTSIGECAFRGCTGLTSITIPNSVTSIGNRAFEDCTGLTSITIPNSVTSIGEFAFYGCTGLTSITIPNGVTIIDGGTFMNCTGLTSITIPNSVTMIDGNAFRGCTGLTSITIPNSVTMIWTHAFLGCTGLTSITIPNSVTTISSGTFEDCTGLTSITIPNSVTKIADYVFMNCTGLTSITIPNSVTSIGNRAFEDCTGLTSITIPNSVTTIGSKAFYNCTGLTSITIPNSVTGIGDQAFNMDLTSVISLIENPFRINSTTFSKNSLYNATLYVPVGTIDKYKSTEGWKDFVFIEETENPNITEESKKIEAKNVDGKAVFYTFNNNKTELAVSYKGDKFYSYDNEYYGDIVIPEYVQYNGVTYPVTSIEPYAFSYCYGLTSVIIPNTVTSIGENAFDGCTNLTSVTFGNKVTKIGDYAFEYCNSLTSIIIPKSVSLIGLNAFRYCPAIKSIIVEKGNSIYDSRNNCNAIIKTNDNSLIFGCMNTIIPNTVTVIGNFAFDSCTNLTSITIPNSVTEIGKWAFYSCSNLTSISIPSSVTRIGDFAFSGCTGLTSVTIPESVQEMGGVVFFDTNLTSVISLIDEPFEIHSHSFSDNTYNNGILYVPIGSKEKYEGTYGWNNFVHIQEGNPSNITLINFNGVLIKSNGNVLKISDAPRGSEINVYNLSGQKVGSARVMSESTDIITSLQTGEVGIVKIGEKSLRVVIK